VNPIAPVEISTRYATTVESLADAWEFVMTRIDSVGPDPSVTISPVWRVNMDLITMEDSVEEKDLPRSFTVVVEGMVEE
jgi:hypothetical protein